MVQIAGGEKRLGRVCGYSEGADRRTFSRAQRALVSEEGMLSHVRVNSKRVRGVTEGAPVAAGTPCAGGNAGVRVGSLGGSATAGAGTSRVLKTVSFPDMRKIPPPTSPADFASRTCLASLNDVGVGFDTAGAGTGGIVVDFSSEGGGGGGGVEGVWETRRVLMGFRRTSLSLLVSWVTTGG
jgi:hypothetical protein